MQVMWSPNKEFREGTQIIGEIVAADGRSLPVDSSEQWMDVAREFGWRGDNVELAGAWLLNHDGVVIEDPGFFG
jgi:hypothetical protein